VRLAPVAFLFACSQGNSAPAPAPVEKPIVVEANPAARAALGALATQQQHGMQLFAEHCASCHGDTGKGTDDGPLLVGATALPREPRAGGKRDMKFLTAADVHAFAAANMPADDPGTLAPDQYMAILAFVLGANGHVLDKPLDAAVAASIVVNL
jgi:mono/diheme cytochrome c family protein